MSGKPSTEAAIKIRNLINARAQLAAKISEIETMQLSLVTLKQSASEMDSQILKILDEMDCSTAGNYGWEGRMRWFLCELVRVSRLDVKP